MGKNTDLVLRTLREVEAKRYEVIGTNIAETLQIVFRVPVRARGPGMSVTSIAMDAARQFEERGWTLTSFIADKDSVVITINRPAVQEQ